MAATFLHLIIVLILISSSSGEEYEIRTTWDNRTIDDHAPITFKLSPKDDASFQINVLQSPFFNDPSDPGGAPGEPFYGLWDYEVFEVFFLNNDDQYLEIEICPYGQHILLLLNGSRHTIRHSLFIDLSTTILSDTWQGSAIIPIDYLPPNVTKMNAYAIHGSGDNRVYESLYPVPFGSSPAPDFHKLDAFQSFDRSTIINQPNNLMLSTVWMDSLKGLRSLEIVSTWNGTLLPPEDSVRMQISIVNNQLMISVADAPFYNDIPPAAPPGLLDSLSNYEVLHLFLLGTNDLYLEIQLGPWGHYLIGFWNGKNGNSSGAFTNTIDFKTNRENGRWNCTAIIPVDYLPPMVTKCNAHSAHGNATNRFINSLYPTNKTSPDLRDLDAFKAIDLSVIYPGNDAPECSEKWSSMAPDYCSTKDSSPNIFQSHSLLIATTLVTLFTRRLNY